VRLILNKVGFVAGTRRVLNKISLSLESGTRCVLLGPNGAGKSSLLRIASGYEKPNQGDVLLDGSPLIDLPMRQRARQMGVLTQRSTLDFPFTAKEVVAMGRTPFGVVGTDKIAETVMASLNIDGKRIYTHLSGGEKQLVQLARVFAQVWEQGKEAFLLLDEPMTALDLKHQRDVLNLLGKFSKEGTGQLIVMHDINLAADVADVIVLLSEGEVVASGPAEKILTTDVLEKTFHIPVSVIGDQSGRYYKTLVQEI